jgi:hypothetical protein
LLHVSVATWGAWRDLIEVELEGFGKLEAVNGSTMSVSYKKSANITRVKLQAHNRSCLCSRIHLGPLVGNLERSKILTIQIVGQHITRLDTNESIVKSGIGSQSCNCAVDCVARKQLLAQDGVEGELVFAVQTHELVCAELERLDCSASSGEWQDELNAIPAEDIYLTGTILAVPGSYGKQGLDRVVCEGRDLRVDAVANQIIEGEELRSQTG